MTTPQQKIMVEQGGYRVMAVPRGGRMAPLSINADVLRQMVLDGTDPATIALHFGVTDKQLRKWSENHRIPLDPEALAKEEPVQRYYTCRDCGAASLRYESAEALLRHRETLHGEKAQAEAVPAQPTAEDFGVHLQDPVLSVPTRQPEARSETAPPAPIPSKPTLQEVIATTEAGIVADEDEVDRLNARLIQRRADLKKLREAAAVLERLAAGGAA